MEKPPINYNHDGIARLLSPWVTTTHGGITVTPSKKGRLKEAIFHLDNAVTHFARLDVVAKVLTKTD